jgi:hypothetical protein
MAKNIMAEGDWINSVLKQRNLLRPKKDNSVDLKPCWAQTEECRMVERLGENRSVGQSFEICGLVLVSRASSTGRCNTL